MALQNLRSSTPSKRPDASSMSDGQIALNTAAASAGLFFKDSNGDLVKTGPVHIGTTAPNSTPATGGSTGNSKGEAWLDTSNSNYVLKIYDGTAWQSVEIAPGSARQLLQTNAAGTDVEFTSNVDVPGTLDVTGATTLDSTASVAGLLSANGIDSSGNVTIGTAANTVSADLTIADSSPTLRLEDNDDTNTYGELNFNTDTLSISTRDGASSGIITFDGVSSEYMRIDSSGNVGIGTNSPTKELEVIGDVEVNGEFEVNYGGAQTIELYPRYLSTSNPGIRSYNHALFGYADLYLDAANHIFQSSGTERMRINSSGNVGIGTSTPGAKLDVAGTIDVSGTITTAANSTAAAIQINGGGPNFIRFASDASGTVDDDSIDLVYRTTPNTLAFERSTDATVFLSIDADNGNVGIGTGSPGNRLAIATPVGTDCTLTLNEASTTNPLVIEQTATEARVQTEAAQNLVIAGQASAGSSSSLLFETQGAERMRVSGAGNVGIGTSSPAQKLDVTGGNLIVQNTSGNNITLKTSVGNTNDSHFNFQKSRGGSGTIAPVLSGDNIGTISWQGYHSGAFQTNSTIRVDAFFSSGYSDRILYDSGAHLIRTNNTTRVTVDNSGNVGIGTEFPAQKLVVIGTSNDTIDETTGTATIRGSGGNGLLFGTQASSPFRSYIQSAFTTDTSVAQYDLLLNPLGASVGIGTSSPAGLLHLETSASAASQLITCGSTTGTSNIYFGDPGGNFRGAISYLHANDALTLSSSGVGSEDLRIDSSGNVGIGTSSPGARLHLVSPGQATSALNTAGNLSLLVSENSTAVNNGGSIVFGAASGSWRFAAIKGLVTSGANNTQGDIAFSTRGTSTDSTLTERMRISSQGSVFFHTTTNFPGAGNTVTGAMVEKAGDGTSFFASRGNNVTASFNRNSNGSVIQLRRSGGIVGSINVTTTNTSYNTSSDYRLKENVVSISDGITRVKQLAPKRFNFIADADTIVDGFLAHEAQAVVPESVTGTHNEVDDDGNAVMQGIDQSKLVPLLTAALQEAIAKIEALEQRLNDAGL